MYSLLPGVVSVLFLGYGIYVLVAKGLDRVTGTFFLLCLATFFWQATWAVLFQTDDPALALVLVRFGYLLIIFLPTTLYHFLSEISGRRRELRYVWVSYGLAFMLGVSHTTTELFVSGQYAYFWGFYPKAGLLHPAHVLQTVVVVSRGLYITWHAWRDAGSIDQRAHLRTCVVSLLIYFLAAMDYLCNYGMEFYPPGVVFIAISLGMMISYAVARSHLTDALTAANTIAHELRGPMVNLRMQADIMARSLAELNRGYRLAVDQGLLQPDITLPSERAIEATARSMTRQIDRATSLIDILLTAARIGRIDPTEFQPISLRECVDDAMAAYPFTQREREQVHIAVQDLVVHGSRDLLVFVLVNLLKNSLHAIKAAGKGAITIETHQAEGASVLIFSDTGTGIPADVLPRIFDTHFTTKKSEGLGIGLAFCLRAMKSFGAQMRCESESGHYTRFILEFPAVSQTVMAPATSA